MQRIQYNSPVILTFAIIIIIVHLISFLFMPSLTYNFFSISSSISFFNPFDYFRLISHVIGHASWQHLFGNIVYILLLGPILEEKYSSFLIFIMIILTALFTGIINVLFFSTGLLGASGVVFMLIILVSIVDMKKGSIPLTFVLVAMIFIGGEIMNILKNDNISQMAHIAGGSLGAIFGFIFTTPSKKNRIRQ